MDVQAKKYLYDVFEAITKINRYVGSPKIYDRFANDSMLQDAVERNLEIIGEALNRLLVIHPDIAITNSRRIVDTRNRIIHGYDAIDSALIWAIVVNHLPTLEKEVEKLLAEEV